MMRKTLLVIVVAGLAMTSCKREHLCNCISYIKTTRNDSTITEGPYTLPVPIGKMKKKPAKAKCDSYNGVTTESSFSQETTYVSCTLQ